MKSKAAKKARHAVYKAGEHAELKHIIAEQNQQIRDLRKLVRALGCIRTST